MTVSVGTRLGPYEIVAPLGAGGMGEVYRARDTRLERFVAIKILPAAVAHDPERLARFEREAKTLAALNHPNIAIVHGIEEGSSSTNGGQTVLQAIVMELVEGPTLEDRTAHGPIPLDEALPMARQIAEALEAAHEQGIIHRDLKPANIKLRPDGTVKVLDFGLAKTLEPNGVPTANPMVSPTITSPAMTQAGVILGTAAYMSPEQAKGRPADKRSDLWAFGCVLYEMLTGKRAFEGEDVSETLASVLRSEPNWSALPAATPAAILRLLRRCLEKDRRRRLADAADARLEIEDALATPALDAPEGALAPPRSRWRRAAAMIAAGLVGAVAAGAVVWLATRPEPARITRTTIETSGETAIVSAPTSRSFAISPDGSKVVYRAAKSLVVRLLDQIEPAVLAGSGSGNAPFFSPDGQWVGFFESSVLKKIPIGGGPSLMLYQGLGGTLGAAWGGDGTIVFAQTGAPGLRRISSAGGEATYVTTINRSQNEVAHSTPEFLPDSRSLLFTISKVGSTDPDIALLDLASGEWRVLIRGGSHAKYLPTGHIVYGAGGALRVVAFDIQRAAVVGTSTAVVSPVALNANGVYEYDVSADGTLVYLGVRAALSAASRTLVWVDRQGRETPLDVPPRQYSQPRIAPDGKRVAVSSRQDERDLWIWDLTGKRLTRATFDPAIDFNAVWTRESHRLIFASTRDSGPANLFVQPADGAGTATRLTESTNAQQPTGITPDGTHVVFYELTPANQRDIRLVSLTPTVRVTSLVETRCDERNGIVSPDGRWLAYESNSSGEYEIYVRFFREPDKALWQVSTAGGVQPLWSRDGRELFYLAPDGILMAAPVEARASGWAAGTPVPVLERAYFGGGEGTFTRQYDVSADGQRFLMIKNEARDVESPSIIVVRPWFEELKRLVTAK